ncbi:unnamed protein product, partial [Staurois parvus]
WGPSAIGDHGAPVSLPKLKKASKTGLSAQLIWHTPLRTVPCTRKRALSQFPGMSLTWDQGWTNNSWDPPGQ